MNEKNTDRLSVYEIGYLVVSSVPEERLSAEVDSIKKIITDAGAVIIADEMPVKHQLAYTMRRKTVSGSYEKYDEAYFGWVKFEMNSDKVEAVKKSIEVHPAILRMLLITTVRENTYLGKKALAFISRATPSQEVKEESAPVIAEEPVTPATLEEMDKSIDEMVKEV